MLLNQNKLDMAAKVYSAPEEVKLPDNTFDNVKDWVTNDNKYIESLKQHLREIGYDGKNMGEILKFPAADGYAQYMVISMKPLQLVHLELGDAWTFQYANLLTATEVQKKIDAEKRFTAFLEEAKKNKESQKGK